MPVAKKLIFLSHDLTRTKITTAMYILQLRNPTAEFYEGWKEDCLFFFSEGGERR